MSINREEIIKMLGGKCIGCGITDTIVLEIHHKHGRRDEFSKKRLLLEDDKLEVRRIKDIHLEDLELLCANCHTKKHKEHKEQIGCTSSLTEPFYKLHILNKNKIRYSIRGTKLPYDKIVNRLKSGGGVFLERILRQTAHSAAEIISKRMNEEYIAVPAYIEFQSKSSDGDVIKNKVRGYTFEKKVELG